MPPVSTEELYQLIGLKDVLLTVAQANLMQLQQRVAELEHQLTASSKPRGRRATSPMGLADLKAS